MPYRNRESKRIPLVESVCSLRDAVSVGFEETYVHYVAHPVKPGPQACLTVITKKDRSQELKDSVVILPKNAPHNDSITNLLYQSCLGLMQSAQALIIKQLT